jgi:thymidylate synthase (FAD)
MKYTSVKSAISVKCVRHSGDDKTVVDAARVSLASLDEAHARNEADERTCTERDQNLINYLAKHKHMSPFEHCHITFWVEAPLYIARQHMRHRTWSYNEVSRRYTSDDIRIYEPEGYRKQAKSNRQASTNETTDPIVRVIHGTTNTYMTAASTIVEETNRELVKVYAALLDAGVCREQARGILPQSMMTHYYATVNLRNLVAFIKERISVDAQHEARELAQQMLEIAQTHYPLSVKALMKTHEEKQDV